jgi:HEAT repeat protein
MAGNALRLRGQWRRGVLLTCLAAAGGCIPRESQSILAVDPQASIPAIQEAARQKDRSAVPALVERLGSDDAAIRFYAIVALKEITGQTMDFHYYDDPEQRKLAIQRWQKWIHGTPESRLADTPAR